jgi:hypothetical protein
MELIKIMHFECQIAKYEKVNIQSGTDPLNKK